MLRPVVLAALTFTCALACARADVYRWVDEQGEPHYSDQWVPGSVVIKTVRAHPASSDAGARTVQQKTLTAANTRISEQLSEQENARAVQEDLAKSRETRCKSAKDTVTRLSSDTPRDIRLSQVRAAWRSGALTGLVVPIRAFCRRRNGAWNRPCDRPRIARRMLTEQASAHDGGIRSNLQLTAVPSAGARARWPSARPARPGG